MKIVMIIQARMGSHRLPGKSILNLAGAPLVGRLIERVKRCKSIHEIILAIPKTQDNNVLNELGKNYGLQVYLGSESDVVDRYYQAALLSKAELIVRLPGDNPTPEPEEIDRIVKHHISSNISGFSTNLSQIKNSGYPDGIGAEVFNLLLLREVWQKNNNPILREHVHLNFYNYDADQAVDEGWCKISTLNCPKEFRRPDITLDVNTTEQYNFMYKLYDYLYPKNQKFHITDIINWYDNIYINEKRKIRKYDSANN